MKMEPLLFKNKISHWPASGWNMNTLADVLKDQTLRFRFGKKTDSVVQKETDCEYGAASMSGFLDWLADRHAHKLSHFPRQHYWAYSDYNHIQEKFASNKQLQEAVDWSVFGFPGRDGKDSTLWVGSEESYTVCHKDTYGCNLVAQIYGRKRWVLFPPDDDDMLYPTRLPFEESSVFSAVNIRKPDLSKHPRYKGVRAHVVTLEPGDVLFVPRHWWHHVQSLEPSISINTWIDMPEVDHEEKSRESITKCLVYSMMGHRPLDTWLNPTEEVSTPAKNIEELNLTLSCIADYEETQSQREQETMDHAASRKRRRHGVASTAPDPKKLKTNTGAVHGVTPVTGVQGKIANIPGGKKLQLLTYFELERYLHPQTVDESMEGNRATGLSREMNVLQVSGMSDSTEDLVVHGSEEACPPRKKLTPEDLLECLMDRDVVDLIRQKVQKKFREINH